MDFYQVLGISPKASQKEIRIAYRNLAKKYHPDILQKAPDAEIKIREITQAYKTLSDPEKRKQYDLRIVFGSFEEGDSGPVRYYPPGKPSRKRYDQGVILKGRVFILFLLLLVILFPASLAYFSSSYHYRKGQEFLHDHDYYSALVSYKRAILILGARSADAALAAGEIELRIMDETGMAEHFFSEAIYYAETRKQLARAHYLMGLTHIVTREFGEAKNDLNKSLDLIEKQDSVYFYLEEISFKIDEDPEMALNYINKVIQINPQFKNAFYLRGTINKNRKSYAEARDDFQRSIIKGDSVTSSYVNKALINLILGDSTQACQDMTTAKLYGYGDAARWLQKNCQN